MAITQVLCRVLGFLQEGDWVDCDTHLIFGWEEYLTKMQADFDYEDPESRHFSRILSQAGHEDYQHKKSYVPTQKGPGRDGSSILDLMGNAADQFYEIGVAMDLVQRLQYVIDRADKLNLLSVDKPMSGAIKKLFEEAVECYLLGLNRACVMVCRAALEAVLERRVPVVAPHFSELQPPKGKGRLEWLIDCAGKFGVFRDGGIDFTERAHVFRRFSNAAVHEGKTCSGEETRQHLETLRFLASLLMR